MFQSPLQPPVRRRGAGEITLVTLPSAAAWLRLDLKPGDPPLTVKQPRTRIGRQSDNDIVLDDASVSRYHAIVSRDADGFWIEDTGSKRGVFVDGTRVTVQARLQNGASIRIGDIGMRFAVEYGEPGEAAGQG
jgi:pSer/pThr/pTyr-binding forkhead associated (FHA) protein